MTETPEVAPRVSEFADLDQAVYREQQENSDSAYEEYSYDSYGDEVVGSDTESLSAAAPIATTAADAVRGTATSAPAGAPADTATEAAGSVQASSPAEQNASGMEVASTPVAFERQTPQALQVAATGMGSSIDKTPAWGSRCSSQGTRQ